MIIQYSNFYETRLTESEIQDDGQLDTHSFQIYLQKYPSTSILFWNSTKSVPRMVILEIARQWTTEHIHSKLLPAATNNQTDRQSCTHLNREPFHVQCQSFRSLIMYVTPMYGTVFINSNAHYFPFFV